MSLWNLHSIYDGHGTMQRIIYGNSLMQNSGSLPIIPGLFYKLLRKPD